MGSLCMPKLQGLRPMNALMRRHTSALFFLTEGYLVCFSGRLVKTFNVYYDQTLTKQKPVIIPAHDPSNYPVIDT